MSPTIAPAFASFRQKYPEISLRLLTGTRLFRLEYGEAHVAIRAGAAPDHPDNVVQKFITKNVGLYAAQSYVDHYGIPHTLRDFGNHGFVGEDGPSGAPFLKWIEDNVPTHNIIFRVSDHRIMEDAVQAGVGIGFLPKDQAQDMADMVEVLPAKEEWRVPLWLVTHMDLHRTAKLQAFLNHMKDHFVA